VTTPAAAWIATNVAKMTARFNNRPSLFAPLPEPEAEYTPGQVTSRPALYEPEQLDRVTRCNLNRSLDFMMRLWTDTRWTEAPMSIYRLGPAVVLGGTVITPQARHRLRDDHVGFRRALKGSVRQPEIVLANSLQGLKFFGHWLGDDCTAFEAFRDHPALWSVRRHAWSDMAYYEGAFRQDWQEQDVMQTDNLILLRDLGFGRRKTERYRTLRGRLREHVRDRQASGKIVFIRRGASAKKREIINWDELRQRLEDRGISIVTPEGDTASFVQNILDASLVITVEGSQACHAIYALREGGGLLVLQPPFQLHTAAQEWMRSLELHCGMVIGRTEQDGFSIDPDEVLSTVDRLLALTENREAV
jgi:hypothetical protein